MMTEHRFIAHFIHRTARCADEPPALRQTDQHLCNRLHTSSRTLWPLQRNPFLRVTNWKNSADVSCTDPEGSPVAFSRRTFAPGSFRLVLRRRRLDLGRLHGTRSPNDIQRVAINYLRPNNLQLAAIGPANSARAVAGALLIHSTSTGDLDAHPESIWPGSGWTDGVGCHSRTLRCLWREQAFAVPLRAVGSEPRKQGAE